jgi:hypothetical protein
MNTCSAPAAGPALIDGVLSGDLPPCRAVDLAQSPADFH